MNSFIKIFFFLLLSVTVANRSLAQLDKPRPNVVVILIDDMIWNTTGATGEIAAFPTPNIDRIANEGINIRYYSTNSLCIPGRASLLTGLYGHNNGAVSNMTGLPKNYVTLATILQRNGYYTALDGKYMISSSSPKPGYNYWFCTPNAYYWGDTCNYNGVKKRFDEHITGVTTDTAVGLIMRVDTPFFLLVSHNATHVPYQPMPEYAGTMNYTNFPLPPNFNKFTKDYPSFLYASSQKKVTDISMYLSRQRAYHEVLSGVEKSVGEIYAALQKTGKLDNTILIFLGDNGFTIGAHQLWGKHKPYEETMRMPLFIRYPPWFSPHSSFDKEFVINTDLFPTILEAAGIKDTVKRDGFSIRSLINGTAHRDEFLYEQYPEGAADTTHPYSRSVRTKYFIYSRYYCTDTTEELFDMVNDSFQMVNLARNPEYSEVLHKYRYKLDSLRLVLNDTLNIPSDCPCYLKTDPLTDTGDIGFSDVKVFPSPASGEITVQSETGFENVQIELFNCLGEILKPTINSFSSHFIQIKVSELTTGVYFLRLKNDKSTKAIKIVVARNEQR